MSGLGNGLIARATLGKNVGRSNHPVLPQSSLHHDLDVAGISEGVGHESLIYHRISLDTVGNLEIDALCAGISMHRAGDHLRAELESHMIYKGGIGGGLGGELGRCEEIHAGLLHAFRDHEPDAAYYQRSAHDELSTCPHQDSGGSDPAIYARKRRYVVRSLTPASPVVPPRPTPHRRPAANP